MSDERIIQSSQSPLNKTFADKFLFIFEIPEALKNLYQTKEGRSI